MPCSTASLTVISKSIVYPDQKSTLGDLKLSVSDLPLLSVRYIQKVVLFTRPPPIITIDSLASLLKRCLSQALSHFPPLAGRFKTDSDGHVYITCNDAGVNFIHATATNLFIRDVLVSSYDSGSVPDLFAFDRTVSYNGHFSPILAVQVTELADGVFIGCSVNRAVTDGTSIWNFFNTFAEVCRGVQRISKQPDFIRNSALISSAVIKLPEGGPKVTFTVDKPLRERIFSFSREAILKLKAGTNNRKWIDNANIGAVGLLGKQSNDAYLNNITNGKVTAILESWFKNAVSKPINETESNSIIAVEISSFQSLSALLWRSVTRARKLPSSFQSIPNYTSADDVLSWDYLRWCVEQLNKNQEKLRDDVVSNSKAAIQFIQGWRFWGFVREALQDSDLKIQGVCAFVSLILGIFMEGWTEGAHDGLKIFASMLLGVFVKATSKLMETLSEEGGDDETPFQLKEIKKILLNLVLICLNLVRGPIALELQTILGHRKDHVLDCIEKLFRAESVCTEQRGLTNQVKMLTRVLKFMVDATAINLFRRSGCFDVAINLRDLIASIELYLGSSYAASLVPAVIDFIQALASRRPLQGVRL